MEKNNTLVLIGILIAGIFIGYIFGNKNMGPSGMHQMPDGTMMQNDHAHNSMEDMMHDMTGSLEGKTGSDFDKEFLRQMIIHHEGAVDMAEMVLKQSNESELKSFAQEIIDVQSREIKMMQDWLNSGFSKVTPSLPGSGVACTMEAKMCPDGVNYVGRQGPNCEFAKCPGEI
jgi:hypothetical protein